MAKKGKKKGGMCRIPIIVGAFAAMALLPSCEYLHGWAESAQDPATGAIPADPSAGSSIPHVGGTDPIDIIATILAMFGLAPAARMVTMAKPFIASIILAIMGRKKPEEPKPQ